MTPQAVWGIRTHNRYTFTPPFTLACFRALSYGSEPVKDQEPNATMALFLDLEAQKRGLLKLKQDEKSGGYIVQATE